MLARGETEGLFQLNGSGMTKHLVDLKPTSVDDINAMVALYRPGPINNIPEYIARKQGRNKIKYFHPKAEKFLAKSYGVLVYQDDLLFTAMELAGYTWETIDKFRKAVGKKIPVEITELIAVEGVGPKAVQDLYKHLKIKNLKDLEVIDKYHEQAKKEAAKKAAAAPKVFLNCLLQVSN